RVRPRCPHPGRRRPCRPLRASPSAPPLLRRSPRRRTPGICPSTSPTRSRTPDRYNGFAIAPSRLSSVLLSVSVLGFAGLDADRRAFQRIGGAQLVLQIAFIRKMEHLGVVAEQEDGRRLH